jgi:hypothetical protein
VDSWCAALLDLGTYSVEQAVGAIKRQVQELGGAVRLRSSIDAARAKLAAAEYEKETVGFLSSMDGLRDSDASVMQVGDFAVAELQKISDDRGLEWKSSRWARQRDVHSSSRRRMLCPAQLAAICE